MYTELIDATRPDAVQQESRWTPARRDETTELRVAAFPGGPQHAEVRGEIDISSAPWLREELLRVILRHGPRLVLDLSGVTFMDCAGIGMLLATRRRAQLAGGWLRVVKASPAAARTIALVGLQRVLTPTAGCPERAAPFPGTQIPASRRGPARA